MRSSRDPQPAAAVAQVLAWAVLLVLSLGVHRSLVVCTGPHCDHRIEFVHESGCCCEHTHADASGTNDHDAVIADGHGGCVDVALALGTGPLPERIVLDPPEPPGAVTATHGEPNSACPRISALRPPTTGPPRIDQRIALLATTHLLL